MKHTKIGLFLLLTSILAQCSFQKKASNVKAQIENLDKIMVDKLGQEINTAYAEFEQNINDQCAQLKPTTGENVNDSQATKTKELEAFDSKWKKLKQDECPNLVPTGLWACVVCGTYFANRYYSIPRIFVTIPAGGFMYALCGDESGCQCNRNIISNVYDECCNDGKRHKQEQAAFKNQVLKRFTEQEIKNYLKTFEPCQDHKKSRSFASMLKKDCLQKMK
jgi:hypothetical protein